MKHCSGYAYSTESSSYVKGVKKMTFDSENNHGNDDGSHENDLPKSDSNTSKSLKPDVIDWKSSQANEVLSHQTVNLELQITLQIDKERVGNEELLSAEYSSIDWKGVLDTKNDVKKIVALCCGIDPASIKVTESIPDAQGSHHPRIVITLPSGVGEEAMKLVNDAIYNYFDLVADPNKELPSLYEKQSEVETNKKIREIAKDFCARRGGKQLPCEILISSDQFSAPFTCPTKVAKLKHSIVPGDIFEIRGKADGFRSSKHKLEFLMLVPAKDGEDHRIKYKDQPIRYDKQEFQAQVLNLPHGTEHIVKLEVQKFTQGKKSWLSLKKI